MKRIDVERLEVDAAALKFRGATGADFDQVIVQSVDVYSRGEFLAAYRRLPKMPADLLGAFKATRYGETARTAGLVTRSRTLGFAPRVTIRRDYCTQASLAHEQPAVHEVYMEYARRAAAEYEKINPSRYARAMGLVSQALPEWRIAGTPFTSGIVNSDNPLRYHHDAGNFKEVWSCMYALASDCAGGVLAMPELRLGFSFAEPGLIMFDGAGLLHGVTAIERRSALAYRYSVVFYGLQQMCNCLSEADELQRIRKVRMVREKKRRGQ